MLKDIKTKAKELVYSMKFGTNDSHAYAKQCASNAVDEIIEALTDAVDEELLTPHVIYWTKVKQEINHGS